MATPEDSGDRPNLAGSARISFAQSSLRRLGSGIQRLDLKTRYSQARESVQQLDIGTKLESSRQMISNEIKERNFDGHRLQASIERVGVASQVLGSVVGDATDRIRDSVQSIEGKDAKEKIGTIVGEVRNRVDARLQEGFGGDAQQEDLAALRRQLRDDKQVMEATNMMQEAEAACKAVIQGHLDDFIEKYPTGTYEQWLRQLHPENDYEGQLLEGFTEIDHRFYVKESDHLRMWNENLGGIRQAAKPRYRISGPEQDNSVVDLLGSSDSIRLQQDVESGSNKDTDKSPDNANQKTEHAESKPAAYSDLLGSASHPVAPATAKEQPASNNDVDLLDFTT